MSTDNVGLTVSNGFLYKKEPGAYASGSLENLSKITKEIKRGVILLVLQPFWVAYEAIINFLSKSIFLKINLW